MNLAPTDEQRALREAVRGAVDRDASLAKVRAWVLEEDVDHAPAWDLAVQQGWTGIGIPEEAGGQGGDLLEVAILAEELGRGAVPADALYATILAARALLGSDDDTVARLADGEVAGALLRPGGVPLDADSDELALVLGAPDATVFVDARTAGLAVLDGVEVRPRRLLDRTRSVGDVLAEDADRDPATLHDLAAWAAVIVAADALGAAQRMLDLTVEYVADRVQFGVPVGSFQAVKHAASEMLVGIEGTRAVVQYAAWAVGAGETDATTDAWVAKSRAARACVMVADKALFLHGAVGYTWEHDLQLLFKRAKSDAQLFGSAGIYEDRIADSLALTPALVSG